MSRAIVRAGVRAWLTGQVAGINTVYRAIPKVIPANAFVAGQTGATAGCVAMVHIASDRESRIAMGGEHGGWKRVDYEVDIQLFFRHTAPSVALGDDAGLVASDELDAIVETLKARIRADRTAGGTVWQWGEAELVGRYGELVERGDAVELWAEISTEVTEMIPT